MSLLRRRYTVLSVAGLLTALLVPACSSDSEEEDSGGAAASGELPNGALINVTMQSTVGVLLDDLAALPADEAAKIQDEITKKPTEFWKERARMQLRLTMQRQYFRHYYHGDLGESFAQQKSQIANPTKGQLPLPPPVDPAGKDLWSKNITIDGTPTLQTIDGHKFVAVKYKYAGILVTDENSPARSDEALARTGGAVAEQHSLPIDPDLLRQRTGLACLTESEFPPNSVDSENAWRFFEQSCDAKNKAGCHATAGQVAEDCVQALQAHTGLVKTALNFERVAYDRAIADKNRIGVVSKNNGKLINGADMSVRRDDLEINRLVWTYVSAASCEVAESDMADNHQSSCVVRATGTDPKGTIESDGGGWRHVLEFNATGYNVGTYPVHIGNVNYLVETGVKTQVEDHGVFEKSTCHKHYHFKHYGDFLFSGAGLTNPINKKNGFCLESTTRYSNNEISPIFTEYGRCINQGVEVGWGDEYEAGLTCQWVDVTDAKSGKAQLGFYSNPDGFLCEGKPHNATKLTATGLPTPDSEIVDWEPACPLPAESVSPLPKCNDDTKLYRTDSGKIVDRPVCDFASSKWRDNNKETVEVTLPAAGGLVGSACRLDGEPNGKHYTFGQTRDCDLHNAGAAPDAFQTCTPGAEVTLSCATTGSSQVVRVCEASHVYGGALDCMAPALNAPRNAFDALSSSVVTPAGPTQVKFTCPPARDKRELGGRYSLYAGAFVAGGAAQPVTCTQL